MQRIPCVACMTLQQIAGTILGNRAEDVQNGYETKAKGKGSSKPDLAHKAWSHGLFSSPCHKRIGGRARKDAESNRQVYDFHRSG